MASRRQALVPLLDIETEAFAKQYEQGVWWRMYGEEQGKDPLAVDYLVTNLKSCRDRGVFDGQHAHWHFHLGFYIGMYHGGVLSPETGLLHPNVTTLAILSTHDAYRGYFVGREYILTGVAPHERRYTESHLIASIQQSVLEMTEGHDTQETWLYSMGCVLGELSGQLFPMTEQDQWIWTEIQREHEEAFCRWKASHECITESLPTVTLQEA